MAEPGKESVGRQSEHSETGAPTDAAHAAVGDGTLQGAALAGLTPRELEEIAESDVAAESGTG